MSIFIETLLGLITVILAALTLILGMAALFGYSHIKAYAKSTAEETAQKTVKQILSEIKIRKMIEDAVNKEANALYNEMEMSPTHDLAKMRTKE